MQSPRRKLHARHFVAQTASREEQFNEVAWNVWGKIFLDYISCSMMLAGSSAHSRRRRAGFAAGMEGAVGLSTAACQDSWGS